MNLWQIIDTSGSITESGKLMIVRETLRTISQYTRYNRLDIEHKYLLAGETVDEIDVSIKESYPDVFFKLGQKINVPKLIEKLTPLEGYFLFFTDGSWGHTIVSSLKKWQEQLPAGSFKVIQLVPGTIRIRRDFETFLAEDVFAALDPWIGGDQ